MSLAFAKTIRIAAVLALVLSAVGCGSESPAEPDATMPDFEGTYSLLGTYTGRTGNRVEGTLVVSSQLDAGATAAISVKLDDNGIVFFALNAADPNVEATAGPGTAVLGTDGSFSISYSGPEVISGLDPADCCNFTFSMQGKLSGNKISGTWTLTRDMPSLDSGTFQATR
jgi:hypothetical protein